MTSTMKLSKGWGWIATLSINWSWISQVISCLMLTLIITSMNCTGLLCIEELLMEDIIFAMWGISGRRLIGRRDWFRLRSKRKKSSLGIRIKIRIKMRIRSFRWRNLLTKNCWRIGIKSTIMWLLQWVLASWHQNSRVLIQLISCFTGENHSYYQKTRRRYLNTSRILFSRQTQRCWKKDKNMMKKRSK